MNDLVGIGGYLVVRIRDHDFREIIFGKSLPACRALLAGLEVTVRTVLFVLLHAMSE